MKYDIWAKGFLDQGMEGVPQKASYIGQAEGNTFAEACKNWYKENVSSDEFKRYFYVDSDGNPSFWIRLFDNEEDARKKFWIIKIKAYELRRKNNKTMQGVS